MLRGRVLLTGGAGFLGRGILRAAARDSWPCEFTIYSRDEQKQELCKRRYPDHSYVLGDIRDVDRLSLAMRHHDTVIHAAALKYVPEAEYNVGECIAINVDGTRGVLQAVREANVETAVLISTDKAVEPINTYGLSKAVAERLWMEAARLLGDRRITACRYGNVIGSTGSVVPLFKYQKETQGFITVTDPTMTRFWLGIDDAVRLVCAAEGQVSGSIVIPHAKAMPIGELALAVCGIDTEVRTIGMRPGERKHERLMTLGESTRASEFAGEWVYAPFDEPSNAEAFELASNRVPYMTSDDFIAHVRDAEQV